MAEQEDNNFIRILHDIARVVYMDEKENEQLKDDTFPNISPDEFCLLHTKLTALLKTVATSDMDFNQLDAYLTCQMKRKEGSLTSDEAKAFVQFWKSNKSKIHDAIVQRTIWNDTLQDVDWRIDLQTQRESKDASNSPVAYVELKLRIGNERSPNKTLNTVQFELDEDKLALLLKTCGDIESRISALGQTQT